MIKKKRGINPVVGMTVIAAFLGLIHIVLSLVNGNDPETQIMVGNFSIVTVYLLINPYLVWILSVVYYFWCKRWEDALKEEYNAENGGIQA